VQWRYTSSLTHCLHRASPLLCNKGWIRLFSWSCSRIPDILHNGDGTGPESAIVDPSNYQLQTLSLQVSLFLENTGANLVNEFKKGGCARAFADAFADGGIIGDLGPGVDPPELVKQGGAAMAANYAVVRGLAVALRSSIFRSILEVGEIGSGVILLSDIYARIADGVRAEYKDYRSGVCQ
jgi:hypothetical protein